MNKLDLERSARDRGVPRHLIPSLVEYVVDRCPTGRFLEAVLSNNLIETMQRADNSSLAGLVPLMSFIKWHIPADCWGSPEKVKAWLEVTPDER